MPPGKIAPKLADYEGLVFTTAKMFAGMVGMEEEDLRQELRVKVWRACESYDPSKTKMPLRNYVYGCIANKVKDVKRNAARRARYGVEFVSAEELPATAELGFASGHEDIYGRIDEGLLVLPSTVTTRESRVLVLLMFEMTKPEVMLRLTMDRSAVEAVIRSLRIKLADWKPGTGPQRTVALSVAA